MSILVHEERPVSVSTSTGAWSGNTVCFNGLLQQVVVKPATLTTMYDFALINDKSDVVYNRTDMTGELNEEIVMPMHGVYTMRIQNATEDEVFTVLLLLRER